MKKFDSKGFTLVELLAVIAILAILVIVAMPNVLGMFNQAKANSFVTEVQKYMDTAKTSFMQNAMLNGGKEIVFTNFDSGINDKKATITVTTVNGYKATATVTVTEPELPYIENGVYFEKPSGWNSTIYAYMWDNKTQTAYQGSTGRINLLQTENLKQSASIVQ